jgi:N-acetylmuramoyl-L-alanine amidase
MSRRKIGIVMNHVILKSIVATVLIFASAGTTHSAPLSFRSITSTAKAALASLQLQPVTKTLKSIINKSCLASALYHEARGEPVEGQIAVALTIINRATSSAYPPTICGVVYQNSHRYNKCQFSYTCDRRSDLPRNLGVFSRMQRLSEKILTMVQKTDEAKQSGLINLSPTIANALFATHYHRHDVAPSWSKKLQVVVRVGDHVFFKSNRVLKRMPSNVRRQRAEILSTITANYKYL